MTELKLREFYELCQVYRHVPATEQVAVSEAYDRLIDFVNALVDEQRELDASLCEARAKEYRTVVGTNSTMAALTAEVLADKIRRHANQEGT